MEASTDLFINLIQNNRIIYDKSLKDFKNTKKKDEIWVQIANQSRMTVEDAKKRYCSLRQKYCREKRNLELKRRNKCTVRKHWVYFDRLHFLDSFILPRSTITNDTGFEEDYDGDMDSRILNREEVTDDTSQHFQIELEDGIDINEVLNNDCDENNNGVSTNDLRTADEDETNQGIEQQPAHQYRKEARSEYTGELSTIDFLSPPSPLTIENDRNEGSVANVATTFDEDNYMSPHPGTSSAQRQVFVQPRNNISNNKTAPASMVTGLGRQTVGNITSQNTHKSNGTGSPSQQTNNFSKSNTSVPTNTTSARHIQLQTAPSTIISNQSVPAATPSRNATLTSTLASSNPPRTATTSKEKSIDAIRQKMDSCLSAMANKITEKTQRSPHAPFLAYLGTKLSDVPKQILPNLEREILELVNFHST